MPSPEDVEVYEQRPLEAREIMRGMWAGPRPRGCVLFVEDWDGEWREWDVDGPLVRAMLATARRIEFHAEGAPTRWAHISFDEALRALRSSPRSSASTRETQALSPVWTIGFEDRGHWLQFVGDGVDEIVAAAAEADAAELDAAAPPARVQVEAPRVDRAPAWAGVAI